MKVGEKPIYHDKARFVRPGCDGGYRTGGFTSPEEKYYESEVLEAPPKDFVRYCIRAGQYGPEYSTPSIRVKAGLILRNYGSMHGYAEPRLSYEDSDNIKALKIVAGM